MGKYKPLLSWSNLTKFSFVLLIFSAVLIWSPGKALAAAGDPGTGFEYIWFRIGTDIPNKQELNSKGVTVTWSCTGGAGSGVITDGTASESTNLLDGIIKVASQSAENGAAEAGCGSTDTLSATFTKTGWVTETWSGTLLASTSITPFTTRASMDYTIEVKGVADELDNTLTLDGSTASASFSGTVASQSYYGGKKYIAGSGAGTVTAEHSTNAYVKRTSGALIISATASQSVDFGTTDVSDVEGGGLLYAYKFRVFERDDFTNYKITSGILTAGDSLGTSCTAGTGSVLGYWYCPVPLADETDTTASFRHDNYDTTTLTYADRTLESSVQVTGDIKPILKSVGGVCVSCESTVVETPIPTEEPTPTPTSEVSPTPTPTLTPTPIPTVAKLYRKANDPKVYVEDGIGLLNWVRTLEQFNNSGYKWEDVKVISGEEFAKLKLAPSSVPSKLLRKTNDPKVYVQGEDGTLSWVKTLEEFNAAGYSWTDVQVISGSEFAKMIVTGARVRVTKGISWLNVRNSASLSGQVVGRALSGEEYEFSATSNGWYKIKKNGSDFGWIFGKYVSEI